MRWGMVIDLDKCIHCNACTMACLMENNVPRPKRDNSLRHIQWMKLITIETESGEQVVPRPCMHCDNPPCTKVCPVDATGIDSNGIVRQTFSRCIGCRYCTNACPYTVRSFNWARPEFMEGDTARLNPDVSVRPMGVVEKCTFCSHRLQKVQDRASFEGRTIQDGEFLPACAEICPTRAITFGDLGDPKSRVYALKDNPRAFKLLENLGTDPKVIYLAEVRHE